MSSVCSSWEFGSLAFAMLESSWWQDEFHRLKKNTKD